MLTKVELPQGYKRLINKEKERKDVIQIIDDEGFLREISFDELTSHPTTISGYGITDAYTKAEVDSLFVTPDMITSFVNDADYNSTTKEIELKHGSTVVATVDATAFIKDGMVSSVTVENGYIVIEFNTDAGHEAIRIPITDIFDSNNYYTKAESDARYITEHQSLAGYTPKVEAIPYIEGPTTDTTAGHWTGTYDGITALEEGLTIIYVPHIAGASTTTLNINGLGAKTCYWTGTSKMTTQYPVGSPILLTYSNNGWRRSDSNTTYSAGTKALFDAGANTSNRVWSAKVLADSVAPIVHTHAWSDITDAPAFITAEALDGYATEQWVQNQGYLTEHQSLANYYTKTEADNLFLTEHQDLSEYAKLTDIPTALSQLSEDATHRLVTDTEKSTWSAKQDAISDLSTIRTNASHGNTAYNWGNHAEAGYAMATDIPENVSELTNDAGYITSADVPTSLAELSSDSTHRLVTDAEKTTWNNKQNAISDLADIRSGAALGATALQSETDPIFSASPSAGITSEDIDNWNAKQAAISDLATIRTRSNEGHTAYGWGNHAEAGYLTSFTETDPIFSASPAHGITTTNITNWNTAFSWGNHASEGYLKSVSFADLTSHPTTLSGYGITDAKIQNGVITLGGNTITPLTSFTETDPTVPSWAKQAYKPSYTASEVGALPDTTFIPTKTSDITNDSGFITSDDIPTNVSEFNNDAGYITSSDIPTNVSAFNNDAGYLTEHQSLANYYTKSEVDTKTAKTTAREDNKLLYNGQTVDTGLSGLGISTSTNLLNRYHIAVRSNDSNPFLGLKQGTNLWFAQAAAGYFYFGPTSKKALRLDQSGNGVFQSGSVTATKIIKSGGTASQFLKADGSVDSNTYLTSHQSLAGYATEAWVQSQGYLTTHQSLAGYATEDYVNDAITDLNLGTASQKNYTDTVSQNNTSLPTSGAVYDAIATAVTSAIHYRGMSSVALTDGGTEVAVIGGTPLDAQSGDVVIYGGYEFLWEEGHWNKLGDDSSYALKTVTISAGTGLTGGGDLTTSRTIGLSTETQNNIANGVTAYGWGNHASQGYATQTWVSQNFNKYVLPKATTSTLGGVIVGDGLSVDANGKITPKVGDASDTFLTVNEGGYLAVDPTTFLGATQAIVEGYNYATETWVENKGYLTSFTETDPTVPAWAKAASKPTYTLDEVSDGSTRKLANYVLKSGVTVPSTVPVGAWNTESTIGTVDGKNFKIKFPAKPTYAFGDLTSHPTTLSGYGITDAKIANGVITLGSNTITPLTSFTESDPVFSASAAAGITTTNIATWNGKYTKPATGVPKTDLARVVQNSLGLADTALQSVPLATDSTIGGFKTGTGTYLNLDNNSGVLYVDIDGISTYMSDDGFLKSVAFSDLTSLPTTLQGYGITDAKIETPSGTSNRKITLGGNNFTIYSWALASTKPSYTFSEIGSKPTTIAGYGITDAKIANGTITLGSNSITPLTSFTETDPTVPSWAKASTKPSYTLDEVTDGNTRKLSKYVEKIQGTGTAVYYYNSVVNWSGVLLTLPFTWSPVMSGMFSFTIRTYISYVYTDFVVSGYDYGSSHWYQPDVKIIGGESKYIFKFGWFDTTGPSGGKHLYVWFGRGQDSGGNDLKFGYGGFSIINVHCGHISYDVYKNWSAENMSLSSLTNVQATITPSKPLLDNITLDNVADGSTRKLSNYVPTTRTINSKALSSNITLTLDDVSDGSTRKLYKTITIQSATEGQYTKETLATLFGVSSSDLSLILDGECYIGYGLTKYYPITNGKWNDSDFSMAEYSMVDRDWDLEKWYLNDITIIGYSGTILLIVKTRVSIATEEAAAHMWFTTYSELVTLKNNSSLVPGKWYGINDYEATTTDTESRSNGHKFGILVLATSSDTLSEECLAYRSTDSYYSGSNLLAWKVWYTVDNDTTRFSWADETNGKGVIYRLIDEWGNDLPYDFKSIQFKRYKVTAASANPELQVLNGLYLGLQSNSKGLTTDTSDYKWFYTFSQLGSDWTTNATDASLKLVSAKVVARTVFGPKVTSNEVTQVLNNIVMMNGALVQTFLEAHGTQSDYEDSVSTDFLGGSSKVNDITTFGNFGNVNVTGCFRWNIFVGTTRHLDFKTDCQNNTVACFDDFCFNTFDDGFNNNVIVTTEAITQNRFGEYFQNNVINIIGYIKQNEFGPTFYNNKIYCSIVNNTFGPSVHDNTFGTLGEARSNYIQRNVFGPTVYHCSFKSFFMLNRIYGQITYCNFGSYVAANTIDPILQYVDIPDGTSSTMFRGAHIHGGIRGTSTAHIALDSSEFRGSVSGVTRAIDIEGDADGKIVATWYSSQKRVGIYKAVADTSWTALPDEIGDINTILSSI